MINYGATDLAVMEIVGEEQLSAKADSLMPLIKFSTPQTMTTVARPTSLRDVISNQVIATLANNTEILPQVIEMNAELMEKIEILVNESTDRLAAKGVFTQQQLEEEIQRVVAAMNDEPVMSGTIYTTLRSSKVTNNDVTTPMEVTNELTTTSKNHAFCVSMTLCRAVFLILLSMITAYSFIFCLTLI